MEQAGEYRIDAPREAVWRALNDPAVLARCIDGCELFEPAGDDKYQAVVKAKVGPVSATFHAELEILEPDPPLAYSIAGQVKAGPAGFGRGSAHVELSEDGDGTLLHYKVDGSVGGKLAQIGQRLIDATARKMADDFFAAFAEQVASEGAQHHEAAARPAIPIWQGRGTLYWLVVLTTVAVGIACLWLMGR
jgi:carbon monoxide dehydrogenase subunit G